MYELIQEKIISIFVDREELTKLITEMDWFVMSVVKYLTYSFLQSILTEGLVTVTLGYLEINLFLVKISMPIKRIWNNAMSVAAVLLRGYS